MQYIISCYFWKQINRILIVVALVVLSLNDQIRPYTFKKLLNEKIFM